MSIHRMATPQRHFVFAFFIAAILVVMGFGVWGMPVFSKHAKAASSATLAPISVSIPSLSSAWSGNVNIGVTLSAISDPSSGATNIIYYIVDGQMIYHAPPTTNLSNTDILNTAKLPNGQHTLYINVQTYGSPLYGYYSPIGTYGPVTFTTNNGHSPYQLRAGYDELWLTPGQTVQLTPQIAYTDNTTAAISAASTTFSVVSSSIATVDSNGNVTGKAVGDTSINLSAAGMTDTVLIHVNDINATPQFGDDGSELTSYVPGKSTFVRSVFFLGPPFSSQLASQMQAAGINTFETGAIYSPPAYATQGETQAQYQATEAAWESSMQTEHFQPVETAIAQGFNVLFTGDGIAGGDNYLYDSTKAWDVTTWSQNPVSYVMSWAKSLGHTIGVEMVDEVSNDFGNNPVPQGQMGATNGPQQIACVNNACTVTWPDYGESGGGHFIITGATSNPNLNVPVTDKYTMSNTTVTGFSFTAAGVGTQTFTPATDPSLVIQVFAEEPDGPYGPNVSGDTDYNDDNAISTLMSEIDSGSHPPITWPTAGTDLPAVGPWQGNPAVSDFGTLYYPGISPKAYPWGATLSAGQGEWQYTFAQDYPVVQRDKPVLFEATGITQDYAPQYTPVPVVSMANNTITFSQPDGVTPPFAPSNRESVSPRFTLTGSSNSALNTNYYVYAAPNATTLDVYLATSTLPSDGWKSGGILTFPDGISTTIGSAIGSSQGLGLALTSSECAAIANEAYGQIVTVTSSSDPNYSGYQWYLAPDASTCGQSGPSLFQLPSGTGTGGTAEIVYNNLPPVIQANGGLNDSNTIAAIAADNITWAAAKGMAGVRVYGYTPPVDDDPANNAMFPGNDAGKIGIQSGINPGSNGQNATAEWNAVSNAFNLISDVEPYLLEPKMQSPDYGPSMVTAARTSSYGDMLMMVNLSEAPTLVETVNLAPYNANGGSGTMYTMTATSLNQTSVSGLSQNVTFTPGETVVWTFPAANQTGPAPTSTPPVDTTSPTATITSPMASTTISGIASSITVSATDNVGVTDVQLYVDGTLTATDTSAPYTFSLNTTALANGTHVLSAKAYDAAGNVGTSPSVSVVVNNAPQTLTATLTSSHATGTVPMTTSLTATADGTASGTLNYIFYCNRSDTGTNVTGTAALSVNAATSATYTATNICTYTSVGTYTAKVIIQRGSAPAAQAQATITASAGVVSPPVITSSLTVGATVGTAFSYQVTASNNPTSYSATSLPAGLSINTATGLISGTPTIAATSNITIGATNSGGTGTATLVITTVNATDTTPPSVPTGLLVINTTTSTVALSWVPSTDNVGVAGYSIYRGGVKVGTTTQTSYTNTGLTASTTYTYTVSAYDAAGNNSAQSASVTATTKAPPDTTPPVVSITAPVQNATVSGSVTITANASDNVGVTSVQFKLNGANIGAPVTSAPYQVFWNTLGNANGTYTISAVASDAAGNTATAGNITVTVTNIIAPVITSNLSVAGTAGGPFSYNVGASNNPTSYSATGLPSGLSINTKTGLISGTPTAVGISDVTIGGTNSAGTGTAILIITVTDAVDTTPPSVPTNLIATAKTTSTATFSWTASTDNVGVAGYKIYREGAQVGTTGNTTYTDTGLTSGTLYVYTVAAYDAAGNVSAQSASTTIATEPLTDNTSPTVSITIPTANSTLSGLASTVSVSASDNVGVTKVELYVDGTLTLTDVSAPYNFGLDTMLFSNGTHALTAKAYDAAGNIGISTPVSVTVDNVVETLTAALTSSQISGAAPLTTSLTATADGTASGTLNYIFYCNRSDTGTNVTGTAALSVNAATSAIYTATNICTYTSVGTYTAKVIIQRGTAPSAQAQATVVVTPISISIPPASGGEGSSGGGGGGGGGGSIIPPVIVPPNVTSTSGKPPSTIVPPSIGPVFTGNLTFGDTGPAVAVLQVTLRNLGFFNATTTITDTFGQFTQHAVLLFQSAHDLDESGFLDTQTQALLNKVVDADPTIAGLSAAPVTSIPSTPSVSSPPSVGAPVIFTRDLAVGDSGSDVLALQQFLIANGFFHASPTGYFGDLTQSAVATWQGTVGLPSTGFFGSLSRAALGSGTAATTTVTTSASPTSKSPLPSISGSFTTNLGPGSTGSEVLLLQQTLFADGDYPQDLITGYYGSLTEKAVELFQAKYGIISYGSPYTTGYGAVGPRTRAKLDGL